MFGREMGVDELYSNFLKKQYNKTTIKRRGETSSMILQQPTFCKVLKLG